MGKFISFSADIGPSLSGVKGFSDNKDTRLAPLYVEPSTWKIIYKSSLGDLPSAATPAWTNTGSQTASMAGGVLTVTDNSTTQLRWWKLEPPNNWTTSHTQGMFQATMKWTVTPTIDNAGTVFRTRDGQKYMGVTFYNGTIKVFGGLEIPFNDVSNYHTYTLYRAGNNVHFYIDSIHKGSVLYSDTPSSTNTYISIGAGNTVCKETKVYKYVKTWWM